MTSKRAAPNLGANPPYVPAPSSGGRPKNAPRFLVLVHRGHWQKWTEIENRCGPSNAKELWDHLSQRPDRRPLLGTVTKMKGKPGKPQDGKSSVYHYEITGAARIDYRYKYGHQSSPQREPRDTVFIVGIEFGSH